MKTQEVKLLSLTANAWDGARLVPMDVTFRIDENGLAVDYDVVLDPSGTLELPFKSYCPHCRCLFDEKRLIECPRCSTPLERPWRLATYEQCLDVSHDDDFARCQRLSWSPWVGKEYSQHGLLILGESHYTNKPTKEARLADIQDWYKDRWSTREVVTEYPLLGREGAGWKNNGGRSNNPTFDNLHTILTGSPLLEQAEIIKRVRLWKGLAFMNFFQRVLEYPKDGAKQRPATADRIVAWEAVLEVISILKPRLCIFAGVNASKWFEWYMDHFGVKTSGLVEIKSPNSPNKKLRINGCNPREATISVGGSEVSLQFLKHPGMFISCSAWREHLLSRVPWLKAEIDAMLS